MTRKLLIVTTLLTALTLTATAVFFSLVIGTAGERVFAAVRSGDSEQHLVSLLNEHGVEYFRETDGKKKTTYTHEGRFLDICYYRVVDGRVVETGMD